ncbi:MAG: DUF2970 domain-containing protein [Nitrosomonas sp.]|nr:MAG: DUF2970 domain-containing protein [Nitrosomonas sp.]HMV11748.1 DUF2970 domain-containing protein [Nitrosomonas sp.]HMW20396.1 DUF2970 domain-containing protein [Nitrosomonas sp.]HMW68170.1 DUF2970 domain-containing protein [Nitrosomonas sp.]HMY60878.1 DUF2970 domain-containing protein [Nitrosomonas sp.]
MQKSEKASLWQVVKAVFWSFVGIRKKSDLEKDAEMIQPSQVVIGGLIGGLFFVVSILLVVKWVTS